MKRIHRDTIPRWQMFGEGEEQPNWVGGTDATFNIMYPILRTPWFGIVVRKIMSSDGPDLHTHGLEFVSLILRGGYVEQREHGRRVLRAGNVNVVHADDAHSIRRLLRTPTWTLCLNKKWKSFGPVNVVVDGVRVPLWDYLAMERTA